MTMKTDTSKTNIEVRDYYRLEDYSEPKRSSWRECRLANGTWRVPRRNVNGEPRVDEMADSEYRHFTYLRGLVQRGLLAWMDSHRVWQVGADGLDGVHNGGVFFRSDTWDGENSESFKALCEAYPGTVVALAANVPLPDCLGSINNGLRYKQLLM